MSVTRVHDVYQVTANATQIPGIQSVRARNANSVNMEATDGAVNNHTVSLSGQTNSVSISGRAIQAMIDLFGVSPESYAITGAGFLMYGYKHQDAAARASGTAHRIISMADGIVVPRRISAEHQGDASMEIEVLPTYNGSNLPFVATDSSAVPTFVPNLYRFTLGPVTVGGISLPQLRGIDIDFGANAQTVGADSDIHDTFVSLRTAMPTIRLRGIDIEWFKTSVIPLLGLAGTQANTTIYLRRRAALGPTFVADNVAEHIKINCACLALMEDIFDGGGAGPVGSSAVLHTVHDGTNKPMVIDTTSTIT